MTNNQIKVPVCIICTTEFCQGDDNGASAPHVLSCGHTFCKSCLENVRQKCKAECPTCRNCFLGKQPPRNYAYEDAVLMMKRTLTKESSFEHELNCLKIEYDVAEENVKNIEEKLGVMKIQLDVTEKKLKDTSFELNVVEMVNGNGSQRSQDLDDIHNEARRLIESMNAALDRERSNSRRITMKAIRTDYLLKLKDRMSFSDPEHGSFKLEHMGRAQQKQLYQFLGRLSYRDLLTYTVLGEMSVEQQTKMYSYFGSLAKTIQIQKRFKNHMNEANN